MKHDPYKHNHDHMRRRKKQRRSSRGAPHPMHYTECSPIVAAQPQAQSKGKP